MPVNSAMARKSWYYCPLAKWLMIIIATTTIVLGQYGVEVSATSGTMMPNSDLPEFLLAENVLIEYLRNYIENLRAKINIIKSKLLEIKSYHDVALNDTAKYVQNPLNALAILKRFTSDWNALRDYAGTFEHENEIAKNISSHSEVLHFPSEHDFDEAVGNLLRIQDIYKLEPARIAMGEVNGVKFGSEMSWSDCFEVGRKSSKHGEHVIAKYWMETALKKLTAVSVAQSNVLQMKKTENEKAKILQTMLNTEYKMGNIKAALELANELLAINPKDKAILKSKTKFTNILAGKPTESMKYHKKQQAKLRQQQAKKNDKSTSELLIDEICQKVTNPHAKAMAAVELSPRHKEKCCCSHVDGNLPDLLLQPLKQELLSADPFIAVYHQAFSTKQIDNLKNLVDIPMPTSAADNSKNLELTKLAKRKLAMITKRLQQITGHSAGLFGEWRAKRMGHENEMSYETMVPTEGKRKIAANVMLHLQVPKLGGSVAFPQLKLNVDVPLGSLLYWTNLNEFGEEDYRSWQYVCPVIAGTKTFAVSSIRSAFSA